MFCKLGFSLELRLIFVALAMRASAAAWARLGAPPPWLPDAGFNGVLAPVDMEDAGTMFPGESLNNDGI